MIEENIIKNEGREFTFFSQGDIFCSLTPEELEAERQEARLVYEKYYDLLLMEEASKMGLMDFFDKWMKYLNAPDKEEWSIRYKRKLEEDREDWDDYKYRMTTYDKQKSTEKKINLWRKIHMFQDHIFLVALLTVSYIFWNDPAWKSWSYAALVIFFANIIGVVYKWSTFFSDKKWWID